MSYWLWGAFALSVACGQAVAGLLPRLLPRPWRGPGDRPLAGERPRQLGM